MSTARSTASATASATSSIGAAWLALGVDDRRPVRLVHRFVAACASPASPRRAPPARSSRVFALVARHHDHPDRARAAPAYRSSSSSPACRRSPASSGTPRSPRASSCTASTSGSCRSRWRGSCSRSSAAAGPMLPTTAELRSYAASLTVADGPGRAGRSDRRRGSRSAARNRVDPLVPAAWVRGHTNLVRDARHRGRGRGRALPRRLARAGPRADGPGAVPGGAGGAAVHLARRARPVGRPGADADDRRPRRDRRRPCLCSCRARAR